MIACWTNKDNVPTVCQGVLASMVIPLQLIGDHAIMFTYDNAT